MVQDDAAAGTEEFEALVRGHRPRIFRFALASLRDRDAAETITQDCFLNAFRARRRFRGECSIETWLMQITVNLIRDHARNRRLQFWRWTNQRAHPLEDISNWISGREPSPEAQALRAEQVNAIWDAAARLPERQRTVFLLRFVEDLDILDIAAVTGMKEGTVKTHLFRALHTVRERMGGLE